MAYTVKTKDGKEHKILADKMTPKDGKMYFYAGDEFVRAFDADDVKDVLNESLNENNDYQMICS